MDDITVSSSCFIDDDMKSYLISKIYGMLVNKGYKPNRDKYNPHKENGKRLIVSSRDSMKVNNLVVNFSKVSISKEEKNRIRAAVNECKKASISSERKGVIYNKLYVSVIGRVYRLKKFNAKLGDKYLAKLSKITPIK